jgi:hypothetical protein
VSRTLQPQLAEFLYALSASDGGDPTRAADTGADATRNGEPEGELGVIRQKDFAWHDQTGAPTDPQAGNIPGGKRDVLRTANFNDGSLQALAPDNGVWTVSGGTLQVASTSSHTDAVAVYQVGDALPSYYEVQASIKVVKPTSGWNANSFIIFDYQSATNFKFAGLDVSTNKLVMGHRDATGWIYDQQSSVQGGLKSDTWYNILLSVNGLTATLIVNNTTAFSFTYAPTVEDGWSYGLNWGLVGFGSNNARGALDNITVQVVPPEGTVVRSDDFAGPSNTQFSGGTSMSGGSFGLSGGRYLGTPSGSEAVMSLANLSGITNLAPGSILDLSATLKTTGRAGFVFDQYSATDYKWAAIDVQTHQILIGHRQGNNWTIDAAVGNSSLAAGVDYTLGVSLRGSTVSVTLGGQAALGFVYNALTVDGRFGVFAKGGSVSFDTMTVKTNDPAVGTTTTVSALMAMEPVATPTKGLIDLTQARLQPVLDEALRRWSLAEDAEFMAALSGVHIQIVDLPGQELGEYSNGVVYVDIDAAGYGWFIDPTPQDDKEFADVGGQLDALRGPAAQRMDLLSVLVHELGHAGGLAHTDSGFMASDLDTGVRTTVAAAPDEAGAFGVAPPMIKSGTPVPSMETPALVIDWESGEFDRTPRKVVSSAGSNWHHDFVNHLGQSASERNPNANLRITLPAMSKATPTVSAL